MTVRILFPCALSCGLGFQESGIVSVFNGNACGWKEGTAVVIMSTTLPETLPEDYSQKLALLEGILEKGIGKLLDEDRLRLIAVGTNNCCNIVAKLASDNVIRADGS